MPHPLFAILQQRFPAKPGPNEDWEHLLQLARQNRLLHALPALVEPQAMPEPLLQRLTEFATQRALTSVHLVQQLHHVLTLLQRESISAVSYKGVALSQMAFGSVGARESSDLDLLVGPRDYQRAYETLRREGFECVYPKPTVHLFRQSYEISLSHPTRAVNIDLHRAFLPGCYRFDFTHAQVTPYSVRLLGREVRTLEPTEHLLVLCVHGSKHGWREPRWVYDLDALCRRQAIDWSRLESLAGRHHCRNAVGVGLALSRRLFGTPTPDLPFPRPALDASLRQFGDHAHQGMSAHRYQWMTCDGPREQWQYLAWTLFFPHQRDLDFCQLPSALWPLYYLIRAPRVLYERSVGRLRRLSD